MTECSKASRSARPIVSTLLAFGVIAVIAAQATARPNIRVALTASGSTDARSSVALVSSLRDQLTQHRSLEVVAPDEAEFVLMGALHQLSDRITHGEREIDCKVSVTVVEARSGAIRLMLSGRAVARGDSRSLALRDAALGAAMHGALAPLERGLGALR